MDRNLRKQINSSAFNNKNDKNNKLSWANRKI